MNFELEIRCPVVRLRSKDLAAKVGKHEHSKLQIYSLILNYCLTVGNKKRKPKSQAEKPRKGDRGKDKKRRKKPLDKKKKKKKKNGKKGKKNKDKKKKKKPTDYKDADKKLQRCCEIRQKLGILQPGCLPFCRFSSWTRAKVSGALQ